MFPKDSVARPLQLGQSWKENGDEKYCSIRYDFKPASVDINKEGTLECNDQEVTLSMPMVGQQSAAYKGFTTSSFKDAVLVFDHATQTVTLEKICTGMRVKKIRNDRLKHSAPYNIEATSKISPNNRPNNDMKAKRSSPYQYQKSPQMRPKTNGESSAPHSRTSGSMPLLDLDEAPKPSSSHSIMSDNSSSDSGSGSSCTSDSDSDSGSDSEPETKPNDMAHEAVNNHTPHNVMDDLNLSEED